MPAIALAALGLMVALPTLSSVRLYAAGAAAVRDGYGPARRYALVDRRGTRCRNGDVQEIVDRISDVNHLQWDAPTGSAPPNPGVGDRPVGGTASNGRRVNLKPRVGVFLLSAGDEHDRVADVLVEEDEALHHPGIETVVRVLGDLTHDVQPVFEPTQLAAGRRRKDRDLAILALVAVLRYVLAIVSETSCSVV